MSTNISVSVALEGLRKLSQAQINANRQAKLLADQRRKLAQEAVDKQKQSEATQGRDLRGQLLYGIKSDRQRPQPQPVAVYRTNAIQDFIATAYALRQVFWDEIYANTLDNVVTIRAMEGGSPIELSLTGYASNGSDISIVGYDYNFLKTRGIYLLDVLPVGGETAIALVACKSVKAVSKCVYFFGGPSPPPPGFTEVSYDERAIDVKAVVFNRTAIRQITPPSAFVTAIDNRLGNVVYTQGIQNGSYTITQFPSLNYDGNFGIGYDSDQGGFGLWFGNSPESSPFTGSLLGSPSLLTSLTENPPVNSINTYALLNSFLIANGVTPPVRTYSSCQVAGTCAIGTFGYDVVEKVATDADSNLNDEIYLPSTVPSYTFPPAIAEDPGARETYNFMLSAWDWGQPTYCRTKLLELGFTTADLTP